MFLEFLKRIITEFKVKKYVKKTTSTYPTYVKLCITKANLYNTTGYGPEYTFDKIVIRNTSKDLLKNDEIRGYIQCLSMYRGYGQTSNYNYDTYINTFRFAQSSSYHCVGPGFVAVINVIIPTETEVMLYGED